MANYIQKSLEEGEQIIYNGRLHWSAIFRYLFGATVLALGGFIAIMLGLFKFTEHKHCLTYTGLVLIVLAIVVWAIGCIVRTRTEFAVTNTRFVQKDGIFNIKMTEIPVARIETVNFYQTVWQRFIGTGCVEMVGSGGTSHQVHCIEHPMTVRKVICSTIKSKTENTPGSPSSQSVRNNQSSQNDAAES